MKLNCMGDMCPVPLLKAESAFRSMTAEESLMVVTDHSCSVESIQEYFSLRQCTLDIQEPINGVWEVTITRKQQPSAGDTQQAPQEP
jgi:TusA-related sulfurtransferase